jgi:hypothetical protein
MRSYRCLAVVESARHSPEQACTFYASDASEQRLIQAVKLEDSSADVNNMGNSATLMPVRRRKGGISRTPPQDTA